MASDAEAEELVMALSEDRDSEYSEEEEEDDELHIAARAGIRLLEENMHFREEVLRLNEHIAHLEDEQAAVQRALRERDAQIATLSTHLRESIRENQSVLAELSQTKERARGLEMQLETTQQELQQRSPRKRASQRQSPRRSAVVMKPLLLEPLETVQHEFSGAREPDASEDAISPVVSKVITPETISPTKPVNIETARERRLSATEVATSPRRRPSLTRLREMEAKYEDEHQRCASLRLELNFAQRRITELKPLQGQLHEASQQVLVLQNRLKEHEAMMQQLMLERDEENELIQSLRQTIAVYEQLNDPRHRTLSTDATDKRLMEALHEDGDMTGEEQRKAENHNGQMEKLERAAEMIDGRFNLREENERLLKQLTALTDRVMALSANHANDANQTGESSTEDSIQVTRKRYLEQQVSVQQELLRRFRQEWQHAHDARVCLEQEKTELLKQLERAQSKLQRVRSNSVSSVKACESPVQSPRSVVATESRVKPSIIIPDEKEPVKPEDGVAAETDEESDSEESSEKRLWERTSAICEALLRPASSKEDEMENELLCFALLRRLVDSWTTDKPKRMKLHDWLTNALRHTGFRKPLYLHELSSEIAMGFQTLMVPILRDKFGVQVLVEKRLRNVIVTDLRIQVSDSQEPNSPTTSGRLQRVHHSLLAAIDGENAMSGGDDYQDWAGAYSVRRASRSYLGK